MFRQARQLISSWRNGGTLEMANAEVRGQKTKAVLAGYVERAARSCRLSSLECPSVKHEPSPSRFIAMSAKTRKEQLQEMLAEQPDDAFLHYGLAMEYVSEGNDEEAVKTFRALCRTSPDYVPAYHQAGQALVRLGRPQEASAMLGEGVAAARRQGDQHAAEEMQGLLEQIAG
jgi:predicted Zn-dependent protease